MPETRGGCHARPKYAPRACAEYRFILGSMHSIMLDGGVCCVLLLLLYPIYTVDSLQLCRI